MANRPEWVFNLGTYAKKKGGKQPGLDLKRATFDLLQNQSMAATTDCCTYYPTFPVLIVADATAPTEAEMAGVPIGGIFIAKESLTATDWYIWMKDAADSAFDFGNNA